MNQIRLFWLVSLLIVLSIVAVACGGNDDDEKTPVPPTATATFTPTIPPTPQPTPTQLSPIDVRNQPENERATLWVVQGVSGLPDVDVYLNETLVVPRMGFNDITSRALPVNQGEYQFRLVQAGQSVTGEGAIVFEHDITVAAGEPMIVVPSGTPEAIKLYELPQILDPTEPGRARVIIANVASDVETIELSIDRQLLASGVVAGTTSDEILLEENTYEFQILAAGKLIMEATERFRAGYAYTILVLNDVEPGTFRTLILQGQTPPQTRVRVTHAAASVPEVAIYLDDGQALSVGISYLESLPFETIASRSYRVQVVTVGDNQETLLSTNISLTPNRTVDLVLLGEAGDLRLLQVNIDADPLPPDATRLTIVNAVPGESQARAISANNGEVRAQIGYGRASNPIELTLNENRLYFMGGPQNAAYPIEDPGPFGFEEGRVYTFILTPSAVGSMLLLSVEVGVDAALQTSVGDSNVPVEDVRIQVINGLDMQGAIDISVDNRLVVQGLERGEISDSIALSSRVYPLQVRQGGEVIFQGEAVIDAELSRSLTLFVVGGERNILVLTEPDYEGTVSLSTVQLRFIHAKFDGPILYIYSPITEGTPFPENSTGRTDLVNTLEVNRVSGVILISEGTLRLAALNAQNGAPQFTSDPLTFEGGSFYDVLLLGDGGEGWQFVVIRRER